MFLTVDLMTSVLVNVRIGVMVPHISVFLLRGPTTGSGVMYCSGSVCLSVRLVCTCNSGMELESSNLIFEFSVTIIVTQDAVLRSRGQRSRSHGLAELDTRCVITDERLAERSSFFNVGEYTTNYPIQKICTILV